MKRNIKNYLMIIGMLQLCVLFFLFKPQKALANQINLPSFTIKTSSTPYKNQYKNYSTYNSKTRQYYTLRSYLEQLEKSGGGILTLSQGTYTITNTLYIPSGVTIILENGTVLKKGNITGISKLKPSTSLLQLISPSKSGKNGVESGYLGETGINIIGRGTAVIDLNFVENSIGIIFGHNTNIEVSGITFQNMKGGHFIELDASRYVTIKNNRFINHKPSSTGIKEAINIDTPDKITEGFHEIWTSYDATPNKDILIQDNTFAHLERAIGTHKYSEGKYHDNVQIIHNTITDTDSDAIRVLNWSNPVIRNNEISTVGGTGTYRAILASGVSNPIITDNKFANAARPIQIMPWKNTGAGSQYAITYNEVSDENIALMQKNTLSNITESFIRINKSYNVYDRETDKYYFSNEYSESNDLKDDD